jgi:GDP-L-fucose synthase
MSNFSKKSKIYIAGHTGMVGSAVWRNLELRGYNNLIGRTSKELNLIDQKSTLAFFKSEKPDIVIDAAARVGGIWANNQFPYEFLIENMQIQNNLIQAALEVEVKKFIFLGSSCIYPKMAKQPIKEKYLLSGSLEETNQWYAVAKISGVKLIDAIRKQYGKDFLSLMPTNLYGPGDNFDLKTSHVLPALIKKFHVAKINNDPSLTLWGTGKPLREFLHVDDLAEAIFFSIEKSLKASMYNVGSGREINIKNLAALIKKIIDYKGEIIWDTSMPDGTPRKLLDSSLLNKEGWTSKIKLEEGIKLVYEDFKKNL